MSHKIKMKRRGRKTWYYTPYCMSEKEAKKHLKSFKKVGFLAKLVKCKKG